METKISRGEYVAPEIDVIELKSQGVLCSSTEQMGGGDTTGWYN